MVDPTSTQVTIQQAYAAFETRNYEHAATLSQALLQQNPNNSDALHLLGVTHIKQGNLQQAIALIRKAIAIRPTDPNSHHNLGGVYRQLGNMDQAAQYFFSAIRLNPEHGETYQALTELGRLQPDEPVTCASLFKESDHPELANSATWLEYINRQLQRSLPPKTASYFHFAAAKLLEQQQNYDLAFSHYSNGNRKAGIHCDLSRYDTLIKNSLYVFDLTLLGTFYRMYHRLMTHWLDYKPTQILPFSYEQLVKQPETQVRRLLQFCDLEWDPNCLNFHSTQRSIRTASANQVRQPLYQSSLEKWRHYEHHLSPLFEALKWGDLRQAPSSS